MKKTKRRLRPMELKANARRAQIPKLLRERKTQKQIAEMFGVSPITISQDITLIKKSFEGRKLPIYIPPKGVPNWSPAKAIQVLQLLRHSKALIRGHTIPEKKKMSIDPKMKERIKEVDALLGKTPNKSNIHIAKKLNVWPADVAIRRAILVEQGKISDISTNERIKESLRKKKRRTKVLNKSKRQQILKERTEKISKMVNYIYSTNREEFDFTNMLPEKIAEELVDRMDWKLQTYNPKRLKGAEETKLDRYFSYHLSHIAFDLKRGAWKKYKRIQSLEQGKETGSTPIKEFLKAKIGTGANAPTVQKLEQISTRLNLNILEKVVLFAKAAGLTGVKISERIGYTEMGISKIGKRLEKRVEKLLLE